MVSCGAGALVVRLAAGAGDVEVPSHVEDALLEGAAGRVAVVLLGECGEEPAAVRVKRADVEGASIGVDLPIAAAGVDAAARGDDRVDAVGLDGRAGRAVGVCIDVGVEGEDVAWVSQRDLGGLVPGHTIDCAEVPADVQRPSARGKRKREHLGVAAGWAGGSPDLAHAGRPRREHAGGRHSGKAVACCAGNPAELAAQVDVAGAADPDHVHAVVCAGIPRLDVPLETAHCCHVFPRLAANAGEDATEVHPPLDDRDGIDPAIHARIPPQQPAGTSIDCGGVCTRNRMRPRRGSGRSQRREVAAEVDHPVRDPDRADGTVCLPCRDRRSRCGCGR